MTLFALPSIDPLLLAAAFLTIVIEVPFFWLCGYRRWQFCAWFACVNGVSNLLLNESLASFYTNPWYEYILLFSEVIVVFLEFSLCWLLIHERARKLFITVFLSNLISYLFGIYIFPYIAYFI